MIVYLTGATGFVGGALARALVASGATVRALVRPKSERRHLADVPLEWVEGDICDAASLRGQAAGADIVVHAAGRLGAWGVPEATYHALHVGGTRNVLEQARRSGISRVLYISSPGVLGPIRRGPAEEDAPLRPSNAYERSKAAAEQVARRYARGGLSVVIARPEFMYGPGDTHVLGLFRAVAQSRFLLIDGGSHLCHPTFIGDGVDGMLRCLQHGGSGEIYHITGPRPVTFRELGNVIADSLDVSRPYLSVPRPLAMAGSAVLELVAKLTGTAPPLSRTAAAFFSEDRHFSYEKARVGLGYKPQVDLRSGVQHTVAWYRAEGLLQGQRKERESNDGP
jgi:nucleoside-diphosphate-sugar epimerase